MKRINGFFLVIFTLSLSCLTSSSSKTYFTGAVYEHTRQDDGKPTGVAKNLEYYGRAARLARQQGADLILFPEYGIFPPGNRNSIKEHLESIPNPKEVRVVPCNENYSQKSPILYSLSCMAKNNGIVVVANMGGIESCIGQPDCAEDGDRHLNANVAFDKNGTLVGRFYKEHLYFEMAMDLPKEKQDPVFVTDIGKFGMFICFEIIFKKMANVSQLKDIDAILFSTMWLNSSPFYTATQFFQAWAMGNNATLLAANIQMPGYLAAGSGIFRGRDGALASTFNPDGIPKLVVSTVPYRNHKIIPTSTITAITENGTEPWINDGKDLPSICSYDVLGKPIDIKKDYRCVSQNVQNFTLAKLNNTSDHLQICHNGMCCELDYVANSMNESFYFGVFNGTHIPYHRYPWAEENCFLARCDEFNGTACANFPMKSETFFKEIVMRANFTSKHVYPSLVRSNMRLVPVNEWAYGFKQNRPTIEYSSSYGMPILGVTLNGRAFKRDPPYVR